MNAASGMYQKILSAYHFVKVYRQHFPMAAKAIFTVRCTILVIRGSIRGSKKSILMLYIGRRWNENFLLSLLFDNYEIVSADSVSIFMVRSRGRSLPDDADIEIIDLGWPYDGLFKRHGCYLEFADWINMTLDLQKDWESVVRSFRNTARNNDLRLIRRNQYRFEVTNDPEAIETFYDDMYLPSVRQRHGAASIVAPRGHVLRSARRGKLLQIYMGDELVVAGVIHPEDDILYFLWQGSAPNFLGSPPEGAVSALYYFGIRYAFDNRIGAVDFAGTRAFLDFGDFRFKRKWGALVDDSFSPNSVLLRPLNNYEDTISFCARFPLIARCDGGVEALVVRQDVAVNTDFLRRIHKEYNCGGLMRIVVICVSDKPGKTITTEDIDGREFHVIQCHRDQFASHYVSRPSTTL